MARLVPKQNKPENDIVYTPDYLAEEIIRHFNPIGKTLDPSSGQGAFYDKLPDPKDWCELDRGRDFFLYNNKVDWIITNPPWSIIKPFLIHSITISDNIVFLITINHLTTKARLRLIKEAGFYIKEIYCVKTPKYNWPQSGFQLAAIHLAKGIGDIKFTFE